MNTIESISISNQNYLHKIRPERSRQNNQIQQFLRRDITIMNEGYVDSIKMIDNIRILVLNPHGFDP